MSVEEKDALSSVAGAMLRVTVAGRVLAAAEGLLAIQQPLKAREFLRASVADPLLGDFEPLSQFEKNLTRATDHADSFERFAARYSGEITVDDMDFVLGQPRNQAALREARTALTGKENPFLLSVGPWTGRLEEKLLEEFPGLHVTFVELCNFAPRLEYLEGRFPGRVAWYKPKGYFDLPKRADGYDITLCNEVLEHQPSPVSYLAFLSEQSATLFLSVPMAERWFFAKDLIDPVNNPDQWLAHLHGFDAESFARCFRLLDLPVEVTQLATGHLVGVSRAVKHD